MEFDDELDIGGDIFTDYNEDIKISQIHEDERLWHYGRFFSLYFGLGLTSFDGNRGLLYRSSDRPSYGFGLYYFKDFQSSYGMGLQYSDHHFFIDRPVRAYLADPLGYVDVSMLRMYVAHKYYIDTFNLTTALTYSNPYFVAKNRILVSYQQISGSKCLSR